MRGRKVLRCLDLYSLVDLGKEFGFYVNCNIQPLYMFKQERGFCFKNLTQAAVMWMERDEVDTGNPFKGGSGRIG